MISVYQNSSGFRVVAGAHVPAAEHKKLQPRIYSTAAAAYATETTPAIRHAISRLDASVLATVTPDKMHHVVKAGVKSVSISPRKLDSESLLRSHIVAEGRGAVNENPDGCYYCGSSSHHSGDCQERE